ncbi:MAG: glycosyltransferase [Betaproteobacteria bacterium]
MITLVIASYHYGHLAAHCIESILAQSKRPQRIIFVDDGAFDCHHLPALYPEIEYILREKNLGTVENFQNILMQVDTEYVMFLGADNWLRADTIELLSDSQSDIVTYDIVVTGELKNEILERVPHQTLNYQGDFYWDRQGLHHGSMMYRTSIGKKIGYAVSNHHAIHSQEDWNLWDKMIELGASVSSIKEGLLYYRRHRENYLKYSDEINQLSNARDNLSKVQEPELLEI